MTQGLDSLIPDALRYIEGATDDTAENAYFELERIMSDAPEAGLALLQRLAAAVDEDSLDTLGAGILESFIRRHGASQPQAVAEAIIGSRPLLAAIRAVNPIAIPSALRNALPPGVPPN